MTVYTHSQKQAIWLAGYLTAQGGTVTAVEKAPRGWGVVRVNKLPVT